MPTSMFPFGRSRACSASSISLQPGGSIDTMHTFPRRSYHSKTGGAPTSRPRAFSSVICQSLGGRQSSTSFENTLGGISCSSSSTCVSTSRSPISPSVLRVTPTTHPHLV